MIKFLALEDGEKLTHDYYQKDKKLPYVLSGMI